MLTPPNALNPSSVTIEDQEFEEYEEPPVFRKGSIFTSSSSGSAYVAPDELSPRELDRLLRLAKDKVLDALIGYLKATDTDAGRFAKEICDAILAKCLIGGQRQLRRHIRC
ncbi:unnamed protein product [Lactuca virosa]|uniref:Uncharacterized protein n=1 Tax=Lactuca virosa TaxID=75947 RepID=A0AAU9PSF3_9ASTR|nr:unnamed protein product [Lactuca virosa]